MSDQFISSAVFDSNLELLNTWAPELAHRVLKHQVLLQLDVINSRSGKSVPVLDGRALHSSYDPEKEATKLVDSWDISESGHQVIFGLGFGYHIEEFLKRSKQKVAVVEPDLGLFKTFLNHIPLDNKWSQVEFFVGEPPARLISRNGKLDWEGLPHPPSVQRSQDYFDKLKHGTELTSLLEEKQLRVLVIPPIYGGSLPTARFCNNALLEMGHRTAMVNCDEFADNFFAIKDVTSNKKHSEILAKQFMSMMDEVIVAKAAEFQPDLILGLAQAPLGESAIKRLRQLGVPIAFWFVEDFRTLTYWKDTATLYDYFFTIQQEPFTDELHSLNVKNIYYLPQACSPDIQRPLDLNVEDRKEFGADLSFMGAAYYNRLQTFPRLLDFDFKIWGTGWDAGSILGPNLQKNGERVSSEDCVKIFNGAKINLNLHSSTFHEGVHPEGDFVNPRTFEIAACEAFQLVDERSELASLFQIGKEIATFTDIEDLKEKIKYFQEHPEERKDIARKGRQRALKEHTFRHRMQEMLLVVFEGKKEILEKRINGRVSPVDILRKEAGENTELGLYLKQFEDQEEFSLSSVADHIKQGEGELSKNELLFLMMDQVVK